MGWDITSIVITLIITVASFFWKAFFSTQQKQYSGEDRRQSDYEWKERIVDRLAKVETGQEDIEKVIDRFKNDVKSDIDDLRIDVKNLIKSIKNHV